MTKTCALLASGLLLSVPAFAGQVLMVADELPAMQYLAARLQADENIASQVVPQEQLPASLSPFSAIIVYIHGRLAPPTERALIQYTEAGGKLIALHHSISSGKRQNKQWFPFLGVKLLTGDVSEGGYKWIEPVTLEVVNLKPDHFITRHKIQYPTNLVYTPSNVAGGSQARPGFVLHDSEVYLNHVLTEPRTILLGFKYTDVKSGKVYMQDRAGWLKPAGRGLIIYLMPGHSLRDFQQPVYRRLILNAVLYQPTSR